MTKHALPTHFNDVRCVMPARSVRRHSINHDGAQIDFRIIHRPAVTRRIHLEIDGDGSLQVVAPSRMSQRAIKQALQQRSHRVVRFLAEARSQQRDLRDLHYVDGEEHLFLGQLYPLEVVLRPGRRSTVELNKERIRIVVPEETAARISKQLQNWYRQQAQEYFSQRLAVISESAPWTGGQTPPMRLRRMKRTWGNCSAIGLITLNTHLVKALSELVDYVIAHEVCHLQEHNHSPAFYALQQQLYPNWREAKARLKEKGHLYLHM